MKNELTPLVNELCYLAVARNAINTRRHRARFRKNYYAHAIRVVEAHNVSNYELRQLRKRLENTKVDTVDGVMEVARLQGRIAAIEDSMLYLRQQYPKPKKWQAMGLHKLRSLVLQGESEYALAKHQTMEFSIKHRSRVKYLTGVLNCNLGYDNGSVVAIGFKDKKLDALYNEDIHHYAEQHELNMAVEKMVEE